MSEDDAAPPRKVKDLLKSGELDAKQTKGDRFGERHLRRHLRRPVGNSEKLWKKVEGEDPWDVPGLPEAPKQRGVYAAGRFVRIDHASKRKDSKEEASHVPAWARAAQAKREAARSSGDEGEVKATPTADDPLARLMQTMSQRNAEAEAERAKKADAAARLAKAQSKGPEEVDQLPDIPGATRLGTGGSERASVSNSGRIRTARGGMLKPAEVQKDKPKVDPSQRRMAAGRAPPKARSAPNEIPLEMRRPPRVDFDPNKKKERIDPALRRMAAGRAPAKRREKADEIPLEMRRPPRIDPNAPEPATEAPVPHRMAAGRAPPKPRAAAKDIPLEMRRPPRIGDDGEALPQDATPDAPPPRATTPTLPAPAPPAMGATPPSAAPDKPVNRSPSGGGGGLDDLFGMAQQEGRVRIGRRKKKTAEPEPDDEG